ncbi:hypothetical protein O9G_005017 [Rozella allomycis CSF55]|uniref:Domain of unknown function at the cortex 1 domain-containing protein n=1 Tax=Rozella allomycis (strain CSF55) TaxID=988480 RepID=A0A075B0U6_ROZAC|nr:hypothetical protein O9G_005017 [Rozella allomycis CSF55]|eukprot:EPZ36116.1 hypothetical protein O9G_005017 [Rozella allomycis CSF55]
MTMDLSKKLYVKGNLYSGKKEESKGKLLRVNDEKHPLFVENDYFVGHLVMRIKDFDGICPFEQSSSWRNSLYNVYDAPITTCSYFEGKKRLVSLQGRFLNPECTEDVIFGVFFDNPLKLPAMSSIGIAIAKYIDPTMIVNLDADKPHAFSPLVSAMNILAVQNESSLVCNGLSSEPGGNYSTPLPKRKCREMNKLQENFLDQLNINYSESILNKPQKASLSHSIQKYLRKIADDQSNVPANIRRRREYFQDPENRKRHYFDPSKIYSMEFYSQYADLNAYKLNLGLSFDLFPIIGNQPIRYCAKSRDGQRTFFSIEIGHI